MAPTMLLSRVSTLSVVSSQHVAEPDASLSARGSLGARQESSLRASTSLALFPEARRVQLNLVSRPRKAFVSFQNTTRKEVPMKFHCAAEDASAETSAEPSAKSSAKPSAESSAKPSAAPPAEAKPDPKPVPKDDAPKKPAFTMKKGQIVRVDKEKYLNSIEYYAVAHPKFYKGIDYIYEDRGEILDLRFFEAGEYALITWAGIPTAPAWLPTYMLIKSEKLSYKRM